MKVSLRELYKTKDKEINTWDNSGDNSPTSTTHDSFNFSSSKRSRREIEKRVVRVPIKDVESSRYKGDLTLPSDSWSWRKYGQKPIKGSPYPRGYYRCSSSKGCPARKQVERSHSDPNMIVITYSHDHSHTTWQITCNNNKNHHTTNNKTPPSIEDNNPRLADNIIRETNPSSDQEHMEPPLVPNMTDGFGWFDSMDYHGQDHGLMANSSSNIMGEFDHMVVNNNSKMFPIKEEEEEELFAGLGELPECSAVFS